MGDKFVVVTTPLARFPSLNNTNENITEKVSCGDNSTIPLIYETYYLYLPQNNFEPEIYFQGIKMMVFRNETHKFHKVFLLFHLMCTSN